MLCWAAKVVAHAMMVRQIDQTIGPKWCIAPRCGACCGVEKQLSALRVAGLAPIHVFGSACAQALRSRAVDSRRRSTQSSLKVSFCVPPQHTHRLSCPPRRSDRGSAGMLQAVRGSRLPSACGLRPAICGPPRPATRSRSTRGLRAAVATAQGYPQGYLQGFAPALQQRLADLGKTLQARRINKALAVAELELAAAEAAAAAAEFHLAMVAAEKDATIAELEMQARAGCRCAALWYK